MVSAGEVEAPEGPPVKREREPAALPKCAARGVGSLPTCVGPSPEPGWFLRAFHRLRYTNCQPQDFLWTPDLLLLLRPVSSAPPPNIKVLEPGLPKNIELGGT